MEIIIAVYFCLQISLVIASILLYTASGNSLPIPNTYNDRTWWKYTKLTLYWVCFGIAHLPWIIGKNTNIRSLFKKE